MITATATHNRSWIESRIDSRVLSTRIKAAKTKLAQLRYKERYIGLTTEQIIDMENIASFLKQQGVSVR